MALITILGFHRILIGGSLILLILAPSALSTRAVGSLIAIAMLSSHVFGELDVLVPSVLVCL